MLCSPTPPSAGGAFQAQVDISEESIPDPKATPSFCTPSSQPQHPGEARDPSPERSLALDECQDWDRDLLPEGSALRAAAAPARAPARQQTPVRGASRSASAAASPQVTPRREAVVAQPPAAQPPLVLPAVTEPEPVLFANGAETPVQGEKVEYHSTTYQCWIPAVVCSVDPESGETAINVKPQKLTLRDVQRLLRPRTMPGDLQLRWVRNVISEGRIDDEARIFFGRYAVTLPNSTTPVLAVEQGRELAKELDQRMGVNGSIVPLVHELMLAAPTSVPPELRAESGHLTLDDFVGVFWGLLNSVQQEYGQVLPRQECMRNKEDPWQSYQVKKEFVGRGTYGKVMQVVSKKSGVKRALKVIEKEKMKIPITTVMMEIDHLCMLDHPHIVKLHEYYVSREQVLLVTDFCSGGDLQKAIEQKEAEGKRFSERYIQDVLRQTLLAIAHVHARGIVHLDIKPANIMMMPSKSTLLPVHNPDSDMETLAEEYEKPHVVIIDLGVAQLFRPGDFTHQKIIGTPFTMAPEVWEGTITPKADIFSCGVVLFEMLCLQLPLNVPPSRERGAKFWEKPPPVPFQLLRFNSPNAQTLCRGMMTIDRMLRPTAARCLASNFLAEVQGPEVSANSIAPELVRHLSKTQERSVLYKSVALSVAREWPPNQMPTIKQCFSELTKNSAGMLGVKKLSEILQGQGMDSYVAQRAADAMDMNRDGNVDFTEFVAACTSLGSEDFESFLWKLFEDVDSDGDGLLSAEDIRKLLPKTTTTETALDVFQALTGRREQGARVDWDTFRMHFKSTDGVEMPGVRSRQVSKESVESASRPAVPKESPWGLKGLSQAFELMERMKQNLLCTTHGAPPASPAVIVARPAMSASPLREE